MEEHQRDNVMGSLSTCIQRVRQRGDERTSLAASVRALGASLTLPEGPARDGHISDLTHTITRFESRTFRQVEQAFLVARGNGTVELAGRRRIDLDLVLGFDELDKVERAAWAGT